MSAIDSGNVGAERDGSLELVMAAAAAQNASKPRYLLFVSAALLIAAVGYMAWVIVAQGAAATRLSKARSQFDTLKATVDQVKVVYDPTSRERYNPNPGLINQLITAAEASGIPGIVPSTASDIRNVKGFVAKQYNVNITEKDPSVLMQWLQRVTNDTDIPGLDLSRIKLTPGFEIAPGVVGWNMEATFKRWQRDN